MFLWYTALTVQNVRAITLHNGDRSNCETTKAMTSDLLVSIIVPCYNEAGHLGFNVDEIIKTMSATRYDFEIILVDDCSEDDTRVIIEEIVSKYEFASCVFHERNRGRGAAVKSGMAAARGKIAGFLDIDLEVHSRYIPSMIEAIVDGVDVSVGRRIFNVPYSFDDLFRHFLSVCYHRISRMLLDINMGDSEAGYKFFNLERMRGVIDESECDGWFWDTEVLLRAGRGGFRIAEVPMVFIKRNDKKSTVKPLRDSMQYLKMLVVYRRKLRMGEIPQIGPPE